MINNITNLSGNEESLDSSSTEKHREKNNINFEFTGRIHNYDSFHNKIPNMDTQTGLKKDFSRKEEIEQKFNDAIENPDTKTNIICLKIQNDSELSRYMKNGTCKVKGIMTLEIEEDRNEE
ncbi:hypothetical protein CWI38_2340p0010 [Hamiltosporidium tvaerminnensis]|uniref:Uncharacterized protein n=1 Tax=Hamiltosporidium tvaerminnensis TaxID=1176355 RepID=A0A4V2JWG1_9MICR|nr:hypothetical protein CWI38_2340p0010 [Hamiltosporidium tvaerminnensis]